MLICRQHRVTVIPVGGIVAVLGIAGLGLGSYLFGEDGWGLALSCSVVGLGVSIHVLMSWMQLRRVGEQLRWRGVLTGGELAAERCELVATLTPAHGREPTFEVTLMQGEQQLVEVASLNQGRRGEAQLAAMADALGLGRARIVHTVAE
jgi:hypothetical protein